jgi:CRISPR-associated protein Cmr2
LRNFSLSVTRYIVEKKYLGKLVYAGGDDVVAFVSLEHLFEVMRELRAYFSGNISDTGELDFSRSSGYVEIDGEKLMVMGTKATASMGVAIAHHLQPLSQSLEAARDMEKWAKQMSDKNAFAISVLKRSGEREEARAHWFYDNGEFDLIEFLITLRNVFSDDHIRPRFIYDLKQEIRGLSGTLLPFRAKEKEISRVMERHKNDQFDYRDFNRIEEDILKLHTFIGSFDEFLAILSVANFVAREK